MTLGIMTCPTGHTGGSVVQCGLLVCTGDRWVVTSGEKGSENSYVFM